MQSSGMRQVGIDSGSFETKYKMIDSSLVDRRNHISHGEYLDIKVGDYNELHESTLDLIEAFRTELQNAIVSEKYLRE